AESTPTPSRWHHAPLRVHGPWRVGVFPRLHEVWHHRAVIPYFGRQFIVKRYRKTYLGTLWIPLKPVIDIASKALLFGGFLQVSGGDRPYFITVAFASAGWQMFDSCIRWGVRGVRVVRSTVKGVH